MATRLTATQVKARLLALLDQVAAGEEVEITKHGRTVAWLVPASDAPTLKGSSSAVAMTATLDDADLFGTGTVWDLP